MTKVPVGRVLVGFAVVVVEAARGGRDWKTPLCKLSRGEWRPCDPAALAPGDFFKVHDLPGDTFRCTRPYRMRRRLWEVEAEVVPEVV